MTDIYDHLTASTDADEVWTSLCGVKETDLPAAPLCPRCEELERRSPRWTWRMLGSQLNAREETEPEGLSRAHVIYLLVGAGLFGLCWLIGLPHWLIWIAVGVALTFGVGAVASRVDVRRAVIHRR